MRLIILVNHYSKGNEMRYEILDTSDGYMVYDTAKDEYLCDGKGDNLFESYAYAEDLMNTYNNGEQDHDWDENLDILLTDAELEDEE